PRAVQRRDRASPPAPRCRGAGAGRGPHVAVAGATRRPEAARRRSRDGPPSAPGNRDGRRGDELALGLDDRLARAGRPGVQDWPVRGSPRPRRASRGGSIEGTGPRNRLEDERVRREPPPGPHGRDGHPIRRATVRTGERVLPGEEVPPGDRGRGAERRGGGRRRPSTGGDEVSDRYRREEASGECKRV